VSEGNGKITKNAKKPEAESIFMNSPKCRRCHLAAPTLVSFLLLNLNAPLTLMQIFRRTNKERAAPHPTDTAPRMLRGSPHILPGLRWSRQAMLLTACMCVLMCEPSLGWWGTGGATESGAVETWQAAKAKEIAAWKICNDTNASAVDAIAKARSLDEAATAAQQSIDSAEKGGFFGATSPEELQRLQIAAQEARTSGSHFKKLTLLHVHEYVVRLVFSPSLRVLT